MLRLENISKSFHGVQALENVSLQFIGGEVHALCGENGAGKSTLMNIIMGNVHQDKGVVFWKNTGVTINNVLVAQGLGISMVYQERSLAESLSIAENIFPVRLPLTKVGLIDYSTLYKRTRVLLDELGLDNLSPTTLVKKLSVPQKQMVEIAKAIAQSPSLLILDEPTASITHRETEILFNIIRQQKEKGVGIIYISHRMNEILQIADRISVLKDGKFVGTLSGQAPTEQIIQMMVGRELGKFTQVSHVKREISFEVNSISGQGFNNINFQLYKGEILGFAGLEGSGRTAMAKAIFGDSKLKSGTILKNGNKYESNHPAKALRQQVVYLPEDRKMEGLFLDKPVSENIFSTRLTKGLYDDPKVNKESRNLCNDFNIKTPTVKKTVRQLSGGNQQKVMLAKWLSLQPDVLIVNEPTHGVDVGAKAEIYRFLKKFTEEGKSIILISSELPELLLLSDRIAVMHEGEVKAILNRAEATEERIAAIASGIQNN